jgi:uncharacterized protein (UPF0262 family)
LSSAVESVSVDWQTAEKTFTEFSVLHWLSTGPPSK